MRESVSATITCRHMRLTASVCYPFVVSGDTVSVEYNSNKSMAHIHGEGEEDTGSIDETWPEFDINLRNWARVKSLPLSGWTVSLCRRRCRLLLVENNVVIRRPIPIPILISSTFIRHSGTFSGMPHVARSSLSAFPVSADRLLVHSLITGTRMRADRFRR
jgi:hypothetical protein